MQGLNINALKEAQQRLDEKDDGYIYDNKFPSEMDFRLAPPLPHMNGIFFHEEKVWWINKKPYLCPSTFGQHSVLKEEEDMAQARAKNDPQLAALLANFRAYSVEKRFRVPGWALDVKRDQHNVVTDIKMKRPKGNTIICKSTLLKAINKEVTSVVNYVPDSIYGITDPVKGYNLIMGATKNKDNKNEFTVSSWKQPTALPGFDQNLIPDVIQQSREMLRNDNFLRRVIRNYFYGEPMPSDEEAKASYLYKTAQPTQSQAQQTNVGQSQNFTQNPGQSYDGGQRHATAQNTGVPQFQQGQQSGQTGGGSLIESLKNLQDD